MTFPKSASDNLELARQIISELRLQLRKTQTNPEWTAQNFRILDKFAKGKGAKGFNKSHDIDSRRTEFLWDFFAGYDSVDGMGLLFVAESEYKGFEAHDFSKLLYAHCPLKLMIFRIFDDWDVATAKTSAERYLRENHTLYSPGEVFVLFGVHPKLEHQAAILQVPGEPIHQHLISPEFLIT